jgi:hypothetical protein
MYTQTTDTNVSLKKKKKKKEEELGQCNTSNGYRALPLKKGSRINLIPVTVSQ